MLQFKNKNRVVLVVGKSGSGKSSYAVNYLGNAKFTVRFIFDPRHEYAERFQRRACRVAAELSAAIATGWVIFDPHVLFPGDPQRAFEMFCEWAWTVSEKLPGQKILFADEVWKHCSPNHLPRPLAMILMDGRKNGIGMLLTTHSPNRLNAAITGEATEIVGFALTGELKIGYLEKNCDEFPASELTQLPPLHYIAQNCESGGLRRGVLRF